MKTQTTTTQAQGARRVDTQKEFTYKKMLLNADVQNHTHNHKSIPFAITCERFAEERRRLVDISHDNDDNGNFYFKSDFILVSTKSDLKHKTETTQLQKLLCVEPFKNCNRND